ncbi:RES family NAD+ phosphorylase [Janthinobacterium sp. HH104]|uniref:RES family NAD+ phosphorylase n=1 Tax=Janthinobacterium sp. HH104 TaxID=1537276 RepID=UPI001586560F|nr:RES family NAD+ phosphorylase [Janthinobacterium sp. HH104]
MAATRLKPPPKVLATSATLPVVGLPMPGLYRISGHAAGEPYFGCSGGNRFDAPGCKTGNPEYSTCYLGPSFDVALAESLLHDAVPVKGAFPIAKSEIDRRWVHQFSGNLRLFDLTGHLLKQMGGHAGLAGTSSYTLPQQWALAVYRNPLRVDGFLYMSRHFTNEKATVVYDRAKANLTAMGKPVQLIMATEMPDAMRWFNIVPA